MQQEKYQWHGGVVVTYADAHYPLKVDDPYFPDELSFEIKKELVPKLTLLAFLKKDLLLYSYQRMKEEIENQYHIVIDKPISIFSYYENWLTRYVLDGSFRNIGNELIRICIGLEGENIFFEKWVDEIKQHYPNDITLLHQAKLYQGAKYKELFRQGGFEIDRIISEWKDVDASVLNHPLEYLKPLFDFYNLNVKTN